MILLTDDRTQHYLPCCGYPWSWKCSNNYDHIGWVRQTWFDHQGRRIQMEAGQRFRHRPRKIDERSKFTKAFRNNLFFNSLVIRQDVKRFRELEDLELVRVDSTGNEFFFNRNILSWMTSIFITVLGADNGNESDADKATTTPTPPHTILLTQPDPTDWWGLSFLSQY